MTQRVQRIQKYVFWTLGFLLLLSAARNWTITALELRRFYTNIPLWDAFEWVSHYPRYKQFDLSVLWIQHNEHREIGTEILFAIDMLAFHGRQLLPTAAAVAAYLGAVLLFVAFVFFESTSLRACVCGALMILTLAGYKTCVISLTIPFLTSWPQWEFFGVAALALAAMHPRRGGTLLLVLSICFAVAATYSMSNGMLVWPLLLAVALLLKFSWNQVAALVICGAIAISAYFFHYKNLHSLAAGTALSHPGYLAGFLGSFLGMPFSAADGLSRPWRANVWGWLALSIALFDLIWILRKRLTTSPTVIVMGGYCLLALTSACLTAAGRMDVNDPYFQAARAGRYITEPTLFWCALIGLSVWLLAKARNDAPALAFLVSVAILSALVLPRTVGYYSWWQSYFQRSQWAAIAVGNGVVDEEVSGILFPGPAFVAEFTPVLAANHLAVFADPEPAWIGRPADQLFRPGSPGIIHGLVTTIKKRGPGYEIQGWADGPDRFAFTDESRRVIGFGLKPKAGAADVYTSDVPVGMAFTGFIRAAPGVRAFSVWAIDHKGRMSHLGQVTNELPQ